MVDNNYTRVLTSLRTPVLDLSVNDAAILRFSSYFIFDFLETINVDVSTDGGSTWANAWQNQGINQFAARVVLDLSASIAGQSNVMLRFRYDSLGDPQGNLWQVDDIELEVFGGGTPPGDPPGPASNPSPGNGAAGVGIDSNLAWTAGALATSHDVYFGTGAPLGGGDFQVNQAATAFDPGTLSYATTYYWRVDEVNADGTTEGATWSFTTETAPVVETIHLAGLGGSALPGTRGRWTASVQVTVADQAGNAEPGVTVAGLWSNGASGSSNCVTGAAGGCTVEKSNLKANTGSVTFTVTGLDKTGMTYDPADNAGGDSITVSQAGTKPEPVTLTVSATPFKVKGVQHVLLGWQNFAGATVAISRDGAALPGSPTANDGAHEDNIGVKGSGQVYLYEVCETGTTNCASATAAF